MIRENVSLKQYTTFKIGGAARYFVEVRTRDDLLEAASFAKSIDLPMFVLGGGSNVLMSDDVVQAVVVKLKNENVSVDKETNNEVLVTVGAGKNWDEFVGEMVSKGYQGIECLSGIPGTVGAAPIQNIGAYGQEVKETFHSLIAFDVETQEIVTFDKEQCEFGYRDSMFKSEENKGRYIVFSVTFKLNLNAKPSCRYDSLVGYLNEHKIKDPSLSQTRDAVLSVRDMKLENPQKVYNSGSFFKNPVVSKETVVTLQKTYPDIPNFLYEDRMKLSAGWLIDNAGWKGKRYKNVGVSKKHALVLINPTGNGTAAEIKELASKIQEDVMEKFGVMLEPEVNYIN